MIRRTTLTAAIVGAGRIAGGYDAARRPGQTGVFTHAGAYRAHGGVKLKTVCETDPRAARSFQKRWKIPSATTRLSDLTAGFHDVISICTPDRTHFAVASALLEARCCRAIFLEKPAALDPREISELLRLSKKARIPVIVNFQRRVEPAHAALRARVLVEAPFAVNAYYIKGLRHIGATMIDTLIFLLGKPRAVLAYNAAPSGMAGDPSVEFVLFFGRFNATVKSADAPGGYAYHLFELDLLFRDRRVTITENSRRVRASRVGRFAYSGVNALDEAGAVLTKTGFDRAMVAAVDYVRSAALGRRHETNRLEDSYNGALIMEAVQESLRRGRRIPIPEERWKK